MSPAHVMAVILVASCGGARATAPGGEIPPIDEDTEVRETPPDETPVRASVPREDLGVMQLVEARSDAPTVTFRMVFDVGSAEDPAGLEGLTRLSAALMANGGAGELTYEEIAERLYPMAASIDVATGREQTVFVGRVHVDHLEAFYPLFRDTLLRPRLEERDFERLKARALSALTLELRGNDDEALGKAAMQAMLYEGHPYAHPPLGSETGLSALTRAHVREHVARMFCSGRAVLGLAGGYPEGFAARVYGELRELGGEACVGRRELPPPPVEEARVWLVEKESSASVAISMGVPVEVTRDHPDYPALTLAAAYLGQHRTFAGRLMQKMRGDRGLNYGDYAYHEHFDEAPGTRFAEVNRSRRQQYFSIWIRPVQREQAHFALRMAVRELRAFVEDGLSEEDFDRVRGFVTRYYALYLQTESRRLGFAIDDRYYDTVDPWIEALRTSWGELTADEVNAAIRRHVDPSKLQIAVVTREAEALAAALGSDEPSPIRYRGGVSEEVRAEDAEIVGHRLRIPRDRMRIVPVEALFR